MTVSEQQPLFGERHEDTHHEQEAQEPQSTEVDKMIMGVMILGVFLSLACESFVASTHQAIGSYFNALSLSPWLLTAYSTGYCMMVPLYGSFTDIYGAKRMLLSAYAIFGLGCTITGCAITMPMAIVGRFITSIGGAGMIDMVSIILRNMVQLSQVGILRSYVSLGVSLGVSCGSPLGGLLMDAVGWRWSFLCQVPLVFACFMITTARLPSDCTGGRHGAQKGTSRFDIPGYLFLTITIGCLVFILHMIGEPGSFSPPLVASLTAACALSGAFFILVELYTESNHVVPLRLIPKDGIGLIYLGQILLGCCQFALISNVTDFLISTRNIQHGVAGIPLAFYAAGVTIGALAAGRLVTRAKRCKKLSLIATGVLIASCTLMVIRWRYVPQWWDFAYVLLAGSGIGAQFSIQFISLSVRTPGCSANVITTYYLCQQLGGIFGTATSAGLLRTTFRRQLNKHLFNIPNAHKIIAGVLRDSRFIFSFPETIQLLVRSSYLKSFQVLPIFCLCCSCALLPAMLLVDDIPIL